MSGTGPEWISLISSVLQSKPGILNVWNSLSIGFQGKVVFVIYYNEICIKLSIWKYFKALLAMQSNNLLSVRGFYWFNANRWIPLSRHHCTDLLPYLLKKRTHNSEVLNHKCLKVFNIEMQLTDRILLYCVLRHIRGSTFRSIRYMQISLSLHKLNVQRQNLART